MSADQKSGYAAPSPPAPGELSNTRVAIVATRWNCEIVDALIGGARQALSDWGVRDSNIRLYRVPGAFEVPLACERIAHGKHFDAVVALGAVIRGETPHFDFVAGECARGLQDVMLRYGIPLGFGVLTVDTVEQATARSGDGKDNKGYESAQAVLEMIRFEWRLETS